MKLLKSNVKKGRRESMETTSMKMKKYKNSKKIYKSKPTSSIGINMKSAN